MPSGYPYPHDHRRDHPFLYDDVDRRRSSNRSGLSARDISPIGTSRFERPYTRSGSSGNGGLTRSRSERHTTRPDVVAIVGLGSVYTRDHGSRARPRDPSYRNVGPQVEGLSSFYTRDYHRRPPPAFHNFDGNYDMSRASRTSRRPSSHGVDSSAAAGGYDPRHGGRSSRRPSEYGADFATAMNGLDISSRGRSSRRPSVAPQGYSGRPESRTEFRELTPPDFSRNRAIMDEFSALGSGYERTPYVRPLADDYRIPTDHRPRHYDSWGNLRETPRRDSYR